MIRPLGKILKIPHCRNILKHKQSNIIKNSFVEMTGSNKGLPLQQVLIKLKEFADTSLAASWDNVGLLIEPTEPKNIKNILLTNDLTEDVMEEALSIDTNMIISYHPPIFVPLKTIISTKWKERIVAKCLENKIALYSPHTSFDAVQGGVNDWLASAFKTKVKTSIEPSEGNPLVGMGRFCILEENITLKEAIESVKRLTGLEYLRVAYGRNKNKDSSVGTVALCAGSGSSVLKGQVADLYLTGEMLHHDILEAIHSGASVILTNHSDSERGFLKLFQDQLKTLLDHNVEVVLSKKDMDPLKTV